MAGEAPKLYPEEGPVRRWFAEGSDAGLALLMLLATAAILVALYFLNRTMAW